MARKVKVSSCRTGGGAQDERRGDRLWRGPSGAGSLGKCRASLLAGTARNVELVVKAARTAFTGGASKPRASHKRRCGCRSSRSDGVQAASEPCAARLHNAILAPRALAAASPVRQRGSHDAHRVGHPERLAANEEDDVGLQPRSSSLPPLHTFLSPPPPYARTRSVCRLSVDTSTVTMATSKSVSPTSSSSDPPPTTARRSRLPRLGSSTGSASVLHS